MFFGVNRKANMMINCKQVDLVKELQAISRYYSDICLEWLAVKRKPSVCGRVSQPTFEPGISPMNI
jgi:hypothetical protein